MFALVAEWLSRPKACDDFQRLIELLGPYPIIADLSERFIVLAFGES
jgi:hypothetical protein